ncbi:hypothetical protein GCM10009872_52610 [Actinopolymorpha rutila]
MVDGNRQGADWERTWSGEGVRRNTCGNGYPVRKQCARNPMCQTYEAFAAYETNRAENW